MKKPFRNHEIQFLFGAIMLSVERRMIVLKTLSIGHKRMMKPKICCLEALYRYGWLSLSELHKLLKNEYKLDVSIGWLYQFIRNMDKIEVLFTRKSKRDNKLYISIKDPEVADWLLGKIELTDKERFYAMKYISRYLNVVKREWKGIVIRGKNQEIPLPEYAKKIIIEFSSIGVDPPKQIHILCKALDRAGVELGALCIRESAVGNKDVVTGQRVKYISEHELYRCIEEEIKSIDQDAYSRFKELQRNLDAKKKIKEIAFGIFPERGFTIPRFKAIKDSLMKKQSGRIG